MQAANQFFTLLPITDPSIQSIINTITTESLHTFSNAQWQQKNMEKVCGYIEQWKVRQRLLLCHNNETAILNQIRNINFPYLMRLDIDSNQICSIEGLATLRISQIQSLSITSNKFTTLKSFRKANMKNIHSLNFSDNPLIELTPMSQYLFTASSLVVRMNGSKKLQGNDYRWICRVSASNKAQPITNTILYQYVNVRDAIQSEMVKGTISKKNIVFMNMRSSLECNSQ